MPDVAGWDFHSIDLKAYPGDGIYRLRCAEMEGRHAALGGILFAARPLRKADRELRHEFAIIIP